MGQKMSWEIVLRIWFFMVNFEKRR